jgi:hypothetical protein
MIPFRLRRALDHQLATAPLSPERRADLIRRRQRILDAEAVFNRGYAQIELVLVVDTLGDFFAEPTDLGTGRHRPVDSFSLISM